MAAVGSGLERWKLPEELIALSVGDRWPKVLEEWDLDYIEHLELGEDSETCLCHHHPIREVCHISNHDNGNNAIVGNCCVKKFEGETAFKGTHKIFDALKRIRDDNGASANRKLIEYAYDRDILTERDRNFYLRIWRKRTLSAAQSDWKLRLNLKIIAELNRSRPVERDEPAVPAAAARVVPTALDVLRAYPARLADPALIRQAFEQRTISERDFEFYRSLLQKNVRNPSERQQAWINDIHRKILR